MTETSETPDYVADAIAALTAAARQKVIRGAGTDAEITAPADFAEIACRVLTSVAANLGGVEELLAGRSGSWEADLVRQVVQGTAGEDAVGLWRFRTEPVRVSEPEDLFEDFGIFELQEEARTAIDDRYAEASDALVDAGLLDAERPRHAELVERLSYAATIANGFDSELGAELVAMSEAARQRSIDAGHPQARAYQDAMNDGDVLDELSEADLVAYGAAYLEVVRSQLAANGFTGVATAVHGEYQWSEQLENVEVLARALVPLPMTGEFPDWINGTPADALRRAGLTYLERIAQRKAGAGR